MRVLARKAVGLLTAVGAILPWACSHDWDPYDPRLEASGGASATGGPGSTSGASAGSTTSSSSDGGGTSSTGGSSSTGGGGTGGDATSASATTTGSSGTGGGGPLSVEYVATVADCIDPTDPTPDPDHCETMTGEGALSVDLDADPPDSQWRGYLRFELDDALAGRTVESVSLRLAVAAYSGSASPQTGQVWAAEPFARADLFDAAPDTIGGAALAPDQGGVAQGEIVTFPLPGLTVAAGAPVFLALVPVAADGVDYLNADGPNPPTLVITYR